MIVYRWLGWQQPSRNTVNAVYTKNLTPSKLQAQNAHLHLGLYALCLVQVVAKEKRQTIYAYRRSLFRLPIPDKLLLAEEFLCAA